MVKCIVMKWEYLRAQYLVHREVDGELMDEEMQALEKAVAYPDNRQEAQHFTLFFKRLR
jgi:hypothetical protein